MSCRGDVTITPPVWMDAGRRQAMARSQAVMRRSEKCRSALFSNCGAATETHTLILAANMELGISFKVDFEG